MITTLQHEEQFGNVAEIKVSAPGRINILGEHLDYNGGVVLPAAVNRHLQFFLSKSNTSSDDGLDVWSVSTDERAVIHHDSVSTGWQSYFANGLFALNELGYKVRGCVCISFDGDIPIGAGMSSSAALCCGFLEGLNQLFKWNLSLEQVARLAQRAEHLTGTNCGLMDQYAVLFSKKRQVLKLDTSNMRTYWIPWNLRKASLFLVNSKVDHQLAGTDSSYNNRREVCERALYLLKEAKEDIHFLAHAKPRHIELLQAHLSSEDLEKVKYVVEESMRVKDAEQAILRGDAFSLGALMFETHQGLSKQYEVSIEQTDFLVSEGSRIPGIYGARMMGGGFGGCVLYLADRDKIKQCMDRLQESYENKYGITSKGFEVTLEAGIHLE